MVQNLELFAAHLGQESFLFEGETFNLEQFILLLEKSIILAKEGDRTLLNSLVAQFPKLVENIGGEKDRTPLRLVSAELVQKQKNQPYQLESSKPIGATQVDQANKSSERPKPRREIFVSDAGHVSLKVIEDLARVSDPDLVRRVDATGHKILSLPSLERMVKTFPNLHTITALVRTHREITNNYDKRTYLEKHGISFFPRKSSHKKQLKRPFVS